MVLLRAAPVVLCAVVLEAIPPWTLVPVPPGRAPAQMDESLAPTPAGIEVASRAAAVLPLLPQAAQTKHSVGPPGAATRRV